MDLLKEEKKSLAIFGRAFSIERVVYQLELIQLVGGHSQTLTEVL
jgi:hypothetical protein